MGQTSAFYGGRELKAQELAGNFWEYKPIENQWATLPSLDKDYYRIYGFQNDAGKYLLVQKSYGSGLSMYKFDSDFLTAISDLQANSTSPDSVELSWSYVHPNAHKIIIQEKINGEFIALDTISANERKYTLYQFAENSIHEFRLIQFNDQRVSPASNVLTVRIPGAPKLLSIILADKGVGRISFDMLDETSDILVEAAINFGAFVRMDTLSGSWKNFDFTIADTTEHLSIRLSTQLSHERLMVSDTLHLPLFKAPTDITTSWDNEGNIHLQWTNVSKFTDFYSVQLVSHILGTTDFTQQLSPSITETTINPSELGDNSEIIEIYLLGQFKGNENFFKGLAGEKIRILPPSDFRYSAFTLNQVELHWEDNSSIEEGYRILHIQDASNQVDTLVTVQTNTTSTFLDVAAYTEDIVLLVEAFYQQSAITNQSETIEIKIKNGVVTALEDEPLNHFSIYPNPAHEYFNIDFMQGETRYVIRNILGKPIKEGHTKNGQARIAVSSWTSGVYFVEIGGKVLKLLID